MTLFVGIAALLVAIAVACVLVPLLRQRGAQMGPAREASNRQILKHQLAELEADRAASTLTEDQYRNAKSEIERRVLEEVRAETQSAGTVWRGGRWTALALGLSLPLLAAALYLQFGNLKGLSPQQTAGEGRNPTPAEVEAMVTRLAERLEREPDNVQGWRMLARSYYAMQRFPEAAKAYAKLVELVPGNAELLADYADALAMAQGRRISGKPLALVQQALKLDPNQWKALAMAGSDAFNRKDYQGAIAYWERLQRIVPPDSEVASAIGANIAQARERATSDASAKPATTGSVRGTVTLSPTLAGRANPSDTVFLFARAVEGPKMPLAVAKLQVKDLPAAFTLDDTQAMTPDMKLSNFTQVVVGARISRSSDAVPRSGDLQGQSAKVKVGATNVAVVIDRVVP